MRVIITREGRVKFEFDPEGEACRDRARRIFAALRDAGVDVAVRQVQPHNQGGVGGVNQNRQG